MSYAQVQVNNSMAARRQYRGKISTIMFNDPESGYAIFKIKREEDNQPIVAKGHVPNPIAGARIVYEGRWDRDAKRNTPFFNISQAKVDYAAGGKTAIRELLVSDFMPGIGPAMADKIVNHFGTNALDIIENHPNRLKEIYGIGDVMMMRIHDGYMQIAKDQELIAILLPYLSMQKISTIIKKFGSGQMALDEIKENPYVLYQRFSGIGFPTADRIALGGCGLQRQDPRRVTAIVLYTLEVEAQMKGNSFVWLPNIVTSVADVMRNTLHETVFPEKVIQDAINGAKRQHLIKAERLSSMSDAQQAISLYLHKYWFYECDIAYLCMNIHEGLNATYGVVMSADIEEAIRNIEQTDGFALDETQKQAVRTVFASDVQNVTVITGGPGSGKTTIIKTIIETWKVARGRSYSPEEILLCAPTGRASARMREATEHAASTIQSAYYSMCGECEARIIVVDEFSMCNLETAHMVFSLASKGCKLVIVGDPDQLPAIGAGNVLRDLIASEKVNICKLSACHRNAGSIVENAIHINSGETTEMFNLDDKFSLIEGSGKELRTIALNNYFSFVEKYGEMYTEHGASTREVFEEGIKQVCLLTPIKKKGAGNISATDLNLLIRDELNPATGENSAFISTFKSKVGPEQGFEFRIGDRVMLCKNHKGSFVNGDMGFITEYQERAYDEQTGAVIRNAYTIRFDNPCDVEGNIYTMTVSRKMLQSEFALAYAMTVHKSQGSEFKAVVIGVEQFRTRCRFLQRNLLYTAVTRAKKECRIVGEKEAVDAAILANDIEFRNTKLADRLKHFDMKWIISYEKRRVSVITALLQNSNAATESQDFQTACAIQPKSIIIGKTCAMIPKIITGDKYGKNIKRAGEATITNKLMTLANLEEVYKHNYFVPTDTLGVELLSRTVTLTRDDLNQMIEMWLSEMTDKHTTIEAREYVEAYINDEESKTLVFPIIELEELVFQKAVKEKYHIVCERGTQDGISRAMGNKVIDFKDMNNESMPAHKYDDDGIRRDGINPLTHSGYWEEEQ